MSVCRVALITSRTWLKTSINSIVLFLNGQHTCTIMKLLKYILLWKLFMSYWREQLISMYQYYHLYLHDKCWFIPAFDTEIFLPFFFFLSWKLSFDVFISRMCWTNFAPRCICGKLKEKEYDLIWPTYLNKRFM